MISSSQSLPATQHTTKHKRGTFVPLQDWNLLPQNWALLDLRFRSNGHWDQRMSLCVEWYDIDKKWWSTVRRFTTAFTSTPFLCPALSPIIRVNIIRIARLIMCTGMWSMCQSVCQCPNDTYKLGANFVHHALDCFSKGSYLKRTAT